MKAIDIIKVLSKNRSSLYKKILCLKFLDDINFHKEAEKVLELIPGYDLLIDLCLVKNDLKSDTQYLGISTGAEYTYLKASHDFDIISRLAEYSLKEWEFEEIWDFITGD